MIFVIFGVFLEIWCPLLKISYYWLSSTSPRCSLYLPWKSSVSWPTVEGLSKSWYRSGCTTRQWRVAIRLCRDEWKGVPASYIGDSYSPANCPGLRSGQLDTRRWLGMFFCADIFWMCTLGRYIIPYSSLFFLDWSLSFYKLSCQCLPCRCHQAHTKTFSRTFFIRCLWHL